MAATRLRIFVSSAIAYLKSHGRVSSSEYQKIVGAIKKTATRDLNDLKAKGLIVQRGRLGPGVHYVLSKGDIKGTKGT